MRLVLFALLMVALSFAQQFTDLVIDGQNSKVFGTLYPNENGSFVLVIKNMGEANAFDILAKLSGDPEISFSPASFHIGQLERQDTISVPIAISVGNVDPSKTYTVLVSLNFTGITYDPLQAYQLQERSWQTASVPLNISARTPILRPSVSAPSRLMPGDEFKLDLALANIGDGAAKDISVSVDPPSDMGVEGGSVVRQYRLEPGESMPVSFTLFVSRDASGRLYDIPITISYSDLAERKNYSETTDTSVNMTAPAKMEISNVRLSPDVLRAGQATTLSLRVENTGKGDAEGIEATLATPSGTQTTSVGKLKKDEDSSISFILVPDAEGGYPSNITLTYTDDLGAHSVEKDLSFEVYGNQFSALLPFAPYAVVLVVALAALILLTRK